MRKSDTEREQKRALLSELLEKKKKEGDNPDDDGIIWFI